MTNRGTEASRPTESQRGLSQEVRPRQETDVAQHGMAVSPSTHVWVHRRTFAFTSTPANGWHSVYPFDTLRELVDVLRANNYEQRKISKLGICAHGDIGGLVQISSATNLTADNVDYMGILIYLNQLRDFLTADAMVVFVSCAAGQGSEGSRLLLRLSRLWRNRTIIGFTTFGVISTAFNSANAPGNVADTQEGSWLYANNALDDALLEGRRLPRMEENQPTAKWARNNVIIRTPSIGS